MAVLDFDDPLLNKTRSSLPGCSARSCHVGAQRKRKNGAGFWSKPDLKEVVCKTVLRLPPVVMCVRQELRVGKPCQTGKGPRSMHSGPQDKSVLYT